MTKIALVHDDTNELIGGDVVLLDYLNKLPRFTAKPVSWQDDAVRWEQFDIIVLRAAWDYFSDANGFAEWLAIVESIGVKMFNPKDVVLWNMHKSYLFDLRELGVKIVESFLIRSPKDLSAALAKLNAKEIVIKPCYGASAQVYKNLERTTPVT